MNPGDPIRNLPDEVFRQTADLLLGGAPALALLVLAIAGALYVWRFAGLVFGGGE